MSLSLYHIQYSFLRSAVLNAAMSNGNNDVIITAVQLFQRWMKHNEM